MAGTSCCRGLRPNRRPRLFAREVCEYDREPDAIHEQAVRADGAVRHTGGIQHAELLANLSPLEVSRDLRFLALRQESLVRGLQRVVIASELHPFRFGAGDGLDAALIVGDAFAQIVLFVFLELDLSIETLDLGTPLLQAVTALLFVHRVTGHCRVLTVWRLFCHSRLELSDGPLRPADIGMIGLLSLQ